MSRIGKAPILVPSGVDVSVSDLGSFAVQLPRLARDCGVRLLELTPTDESLESVFAYLVGR
jgi:ABC-2 type transport system ATP-binding protein